MDVACKKGTSLCSVSVVFKDSTGKIFLDSAKRSWVDSPFMAEAIALREAIFLVVNLDLYKVVFEFDCAILVDVCHGRKRKWESKTSLGFCNDFQVSPSLGSLELQML